MALPGARAPTAGDGISVVPPPCPSSGLAEGASDQLQEQPQGPPIRTSITWSQGPVEGQ